ncbi:hypothetical protein FB567DRAFT_633796 [Paraphoma chrysanthemicola]|uniref:Uncharacterized protein n=1 Tax=Paraphoma chrysanthemicola TaxID=798071 RepID=A0A8K0QU95_9PLEO|nr:hypothetical protein FB567DRAFT_633796 [Paraphoma chrysanthemicola]
MPLVSRSLASHYHVSRTLPRRPQLSSRGGAASLVIWRAHTTLVGTTSPRDAHSKSEILGMLPSHFVEFHKIHYEDRKMDVAAGLQQYYGLPSRLVDTYFVAYCEWRDRMRAWRDDPLNPALILVRDWRDPTTAALMREALERGDHLELGAYDEAVKIFVEIANPMEAKYFQPKEANEASHWNAQDTYSPLVSADQELALPVANNATVPISALDLVSHRYRAAPPTSSQTPGPRPMLEGFNVTLVHLGRIEAVRAASIAETLVETPYCAVARISERNDGTIEGIFAIPIDGPRDGEFLDEEDDEMIAWEPPVRGIYYLGKDFEDVAKQTWTLCRTLEEDNVKIVFPRLEIPRYPQYPIYEWRIKMGGGS